VVHLLVKIVDLVGIADMFAHIDDVALTAILTHKHSESVPHDDKEMLIPKHKVNGGKLVRVRALRHIGEVSIKNELTNQEVVLIVNVNVALQKMLVESMYSLEVDHLLRTDAQHASPRINALRYKKGNVAAVRVGLAENAIFNASKEAVVILDIGTPHNHVVQVQ
jgi:hypothetical protein